MNILFHGRLEPARNGSYLRLDLQNNTPNTVALLFRFHSALFSDPLADPDAGRMMAGLFPGVRVRMYLDLSLMEDGRSFHPRMPGVGILYNSGPLKAVSAIRAVTVMTESPLPAGAINIRGLKPVKIPPKPALISPRQPLIDRMGQWALSKWPGKSPSLGNEIPAPAPVNATPVFRRNRRRPSAFIGLDRIKGRDWLVSPELGPFFSAGIDVVRPWCDGPVRGIENLFQHIPRPHSGRGLAPLGRTASALTKPGYADFYRSNLLARYGPEGW